VENVIFDGTAEAKLHGTFFSPVKYDKIVLILHGLGARRVNYYPIALEFVKNGFAVFIYSFRSHEDSTGDYNLNYMVDDVIRAVNFLDKKYGNDIYVLGGSTGGMVGYIAAERSNKIKKIVVIAAPISFNDIVKRDRLYRNLAKFRHPKVLLPDFLTNFLMKLFIDSINMYETKYRREGRIDRDRIFTFVLNTKGFFATKYGNLNISKGTEFIRNSLTGPTMEGIKLNIPMLFVVGQGDDVAGTDREDRLKTYMSKFSNAEFMIVKAVHKKSSYMTSGVKRRVMSFFKKINNY
jgi:pimeloyl-ACP methyl ester carboxylesterase